MLTPHTDSANEVMSQEDLAGPPAANRHRLQDERTAITHYFSVGGYEGYLTVGLYPNGQPGEIFIRMASMTREQRVEARRNRLYAQARIDSRKQKAA